MVRIKRISWKAARGNKRLEIAKPVKFNITNLISKLPNRSLEEISMMRYNAFEKIATDSSNKFHPARALLKAIDKELVRRYEGRKNADGFFYWPSTNIGQNKLGNTLNVNWQKDGVLSHFGYRVGIVEGKNKPVRQVVLQGVFEGIIPPIFEPHYLLEWGEPHSAKRLSKMAETIASFTRNAKRRSETKLDAAIKEWEEDLEFLYWSYYVEKFKFEWPITKIP